MFEIIDGKVYKKENKGNSEIKYLLGEIKQVNMISETATEKVFQWQMFDLEVGEYVDDVENNTAVTIEGKEYIPVSGKFIIQKTPEVGPQKRIQELESRLSLTEDALNFVLMNMI